MASWNSEANFELNSTMKWTLGDDVPDDVPVWVLVEESCCNPLQPPSIFRVIYDTSIGDKSKRYRFPDRIDCLEACSPSSTLSYLDGNAWRIIAWRHLTDHGKTWDTVMKEEYRITDLSDWSEARKKIWA